MKNSPFWGEQFRELFDFYEKEVLEDIKVEIPILEAKQKVKHFDNLSDLSLFEAFWNFVQERGIECEI